MAEIYIHRNSEWANRMRDFELYLNGTKIGNIGDREVKKFTVSPGIYELKAKIDWCGSKPLAFTLGNDQHMHIQVSGFIMSKYYLPAALLLSLLYVFLYLKYDHNSLVLGVILMVLFGYLVFYISFGRNHYLRLQIK